MLVKHSIPTTEASEHVRAVDCPCGPDQRVVATPLKRPVATITHHPITRTKD